MFRKSSRRALKKALFFTRVRLVYTRITLTRFTAFYFFLAFLSCIILVILQALTYGVNNQAANLISEILFTANVQGFPIITDGVLYICADTPGQLGTNCTVVSEAVNHSLPLKSRRNGFSRDLTEGNYVDRDIKERFRRWHQELWLRRHFNPLLNRDTRTKTQKGDLHMKAEYDSADNLQGVRVNQDTVIDVQCVQSLVWLKDVVQDAEREDLATLAFQVWLFTLSLVTILNESIPHLGAALAGHVLNTAWASFRVRATKELMTTYKQLIVSGSCDGFDVLGGWWDVRTQHTVPIVVVNVLALIATFYLSISLFKVYATQSFSRVGASLEIHRVYKLVLLLSVSLQLAGFFNLASAAIWIDKICHGTIRKVAVHNMIYLAACIVIALFEVPWIVLGWISVRRESRPIFLAFCTIGVVPLAISTILFFSPLYRFIFTTWPFFATVTITSYAFIVATIVLGIVCRTRFGKGLAHYLRVKDALENVDFTPVYFSKDPEKFSPIERHSAAALAHPEKAMTTPIRPNRPPSLALTIQPVLDMHFVSALSAVELISRASPSFSTSLEQSPAYSSSSSPLLVASSSSGTPINQLASLPFGGNDHKSGSKLQHLASNDVVGSPGPDYVLRPISPVSTLHVAHHRSRTRSSISPQSSFSGTPSSSTNVHHTPPPLPTRKLPRRGLPVNPRPDQRRLEDNFEVQ